MIYPLYPNCDPLSHREVVAFRGRKDPFSFNYETMNWRTKNPDPKASYVKISAIESIGLRSPCFTGEFGKQVGSLPEPLQDVAPMG